MRDRVKQTITRHCPGYSEFFVGFGSFFQNSCVKPFYLVMLVGCYFPLWCIILFLYSKLSCFVIPFCLPIMSHLCPIYVPVSVWSPLSFLHFHLVSMFNYVKSVYLSPSPSVSYFLFYFDRPSSRMHYVQFCFP